MIARAGVNSIIPQHELLTLPRPITERRHARFAATSSSTIDRLIAMSGSVNT